MKAVYSLLAWFAILVGLWPHTLDANVVELKWGATSKHSGLYNITTSIRDVINTQYAGEIAVEVIETKGFADNLSRIGSKDIHLGPASVLGAHWAYTGARDYTGNPIPSLRALWGGYKTPIHIMTRKDSQLTSIAQLDGVPFAMNEATTSGRLLDLFFRSQEVLPDYKPMGIASSIDAMESAVVKGWFKAGYRDEAIIDLESMMDLNILPVTKAMINKMNLIHPGYGLHMNIPGGIYKAVSTTQGSFAYVVGDFVHMEVSKEIVKKIVKAVWNQKQVLLQQRTTLKKGKFKDMVQMAVKHNPGLPFHPGAVEFYRDELNIPIPAKLLPPEMKPPSE